MYGAFLHPHLQYQGMPLGMRLGPVTVLTGGANVHFVRSTGPQTYDPPELTARIFTTLNAALAQCRSGAGDVVLVLPGHAENISSADQMSNLVAGTKIIGLGDGNERGSFTWTAAGATFLLDVANVTVANLRLFWAGPHAAGSALTVAAPMTVSAAGCAIIGCQIFAGFDADQIVTIGLTTTAAADDFVFEGNDLFAETAAECTTMIQFVGADRLWFSGNHITAATSAVGVGVIRFLTTASTNIRLYHSTIQNTKAASENAITGMAGLTGVADHLHFCVLDDAAGNITLSDAVSAFETPASIQFGQNVYVTNNIAETAATMLPVSA
jgi:hypothetical protein